MEEQFVPFNIAEALKDMGYAEECFGFYYYDGSLRNWRLEWSESSNNYEFPVQAPLWQQVTHWFRKEHNIEIWVFNWGRLMREEFCHKEYECLVRHKNQNQTIYSEFFDDYQEALTAGILYALTVIKNKIITMNLNKRPEPISKPIPPYGDHMRIDEFVESCHDGSFNDDDGYGYYATETTMSDTRITPSDITFGSYDKTFTHIVWFNK